MKKMSMDKIFLFCISVVILFIIPIYVIIVNSDTLRDGTTYLFKVEAFDPYDILRGNYININFSENEVKGKLDEEICDECYVTIGTGRDGFSYFKSISNTIPEGTSAYYKTSTRYYSYLKSYIIDTPTRYYMNENKSKLAEKIYSENIDSTYVKVRVKNGRMLIVGVYVDGELIDSID